MRLSPKSIAACKATAAFLVVLAISALAASRLVRPRPLAGRVMSGSMAARWLGPHYALSCTRCAFPIRCDADSKPIDEKAVCPNCGCRENPLQDQQIESGDDVMVERLGDDVVPQRWEVVAFASPDPPHAMTIKRVVGLPGETVAIRAGDVYANGELLRKPIAVQQRVAQVVHDDRYRADGDTHWQAPENAGWETTSRGYRFHAGRTSDESLQWLEYVHRPTYPVPITASLPSEAPVDDGYGYNQALARELHDVTDLMLQCRTKIRGTGELRFAAPGHGVAVILRQQKRDGSVTLVLAGQPQPEIGLPEELLNESWRVEFSLFDRQVVFCVNGRILISQPWKAEERVVASSRPFRVSARGLNVQLDDLLVLRDLYYLGPDGRATEWGIEQPLSPDGYFLLGDNVPASRDSRQFAEPAVHRKRLLGIALKRPDHE